MIIRPVKNRDGMALALTITVVTLLTVIVFDRFYDSWIDSALAGSYRNETKAYFAARSGQTAARLILVADKKNSLTYDSLTEEWAQTAIPIPIDGEYTFVSIRDESGKLDLNQLTSDAGYPQERWINAFTKLLNRLELDEGLAGVVVDWIDPNNEISVDGAEDGYYLSLKNGYRAKNGKLDSVGELAMLKDFTPVVLDKLTPYITVWSAGYINANTAPPEVLLSLHEDMTEEMVDTMIRIRVVKPFTKREDIKQVPGVSEIYSDLALMIDASSDYYSVESTATFDETTKLIRAVYKRSATGTEVLFYKAL